MTHLKVVRHLASALILISIFECSVPPAIQAAEKSSDIEALKGGVEVIGALAGFLVMADHGSAHGSPRIHSPEIESTVADKGDREPSGLTRHVVRISGL